LPEAPLGLGARYVVELHDLIPLRYPRAGSMLTRYYRHVLPRVLADAQHVITNSECTARDAADQLGVDRSKLTAIPLGFDAEAFRFRDLPTEPYFLYVGRRDPHKNLKHIITAFSRLGRKDLQLRLAGPADPARTASLRQWADLMRVPNQVRFLDYVPQPQLHELLGRALALVFVSRWEGFGLPVLEAMASGTPVICSNVASLPEVAGDAAIQVSPDDEGALADALRQVADDASLRARLRQAGLARAAQCSWDRTAAHTRDVLARLL
jgi:glycosyltransferase involved in cell wall biosynthesis